jgi:hypothetical protein
VLDTINQLNRNHAERNKHILNLGITLASLFRDGEAAPPFSFVKVTEEELNMDVSQSVLVNMATKVPFGMLL